MQELHSFMIATIVWLQIWVGQKSLKHSVRISWFFEIYNKKYCIFHYLQILCYTTFIPRKRIINKNIYATFFFRELIAQYLIACHSWWSCVVWYGSKILYVLLCKYELDYTSLSVNACLETQACVSDSVARKDCCFVLFFTSPKLGKI